MIRSDDAPRTTIRWYRVYLALTAVAVVLLGMERFDIPPVAPLSMAAVAGIVVGAFVVASVLYWWDVYRWRHRTDEVPPEFETSLDEEVVEERPPDDGGEREDGGDDRTE